MQNVFTHPSVEECKQEFDRLVERKEIIVNGYNKLMTERADELRKLHEHYVLTGHYDAPFVITPFDIIKFTLMNTMDAEQRFKQEYEDLIDMNCPIVDTLLLILNDIDKLLTSATDDICDVERDIAELYSEV